MRAGVACGLLAVLGSAPLTSPAQEPARSGERGYLGAAVATEREVPELPGGRPGPDVALAVVHLVPGASAERAGLEVGDLILEVDGEPVGEAGDADLEANDANRDPARRFREELRGRRRGEPLELLVLRRGVSVEARRDGRLAQDAEAILSDVRASIEGLPPGGSLEIAARREPFLERLRLELGAHPHDRPRSRPVRPEVRTHPGLLGEAGAVERFAERAVEAHGLREDVADLRRRLARLHDSDEGLRTDEVRFVHRHPWRIAAAAERLLEDVAPAGGELRLADRLVALARRDRVELDAADLAPLPRGVSPEEHADALESLLEETAALVDAAFAALSAEERSRLDGAWSSLADALEGSIYLHVDPDLARRQRNLSVLDLARRVDRESLWRAALEWSRLADPDWLAALRRDLGSDARADEVWMLRRDTPRGEIVFGGRGRNRWRGFEAAVGIDLGGDDVHSNAAGGARLGARPVAALIDLAGDDAYEATEEGAQGAGLGGVGLVVDVSGRDRWLGSRWVQGVGLLGVGVLVDGGGDDEMRARQLAQGVGLWGAGLVLDLQGDDRRELQAYGQGLGLPGGFGVLHDAAGDDANHAKGGPPTNYGTQGVFDAWAQGTGLGFRWLQSGGIGVMVDGGGEDRHEAGNFAQGGGYYFGWGLRHERGRDDDVHVGSRYDQGFSAHQAAGTFFEDGGDDVYETRNAVIAGLAWDECVTWFEDRGGDDTYLAGGFSLGASAHNSLSVFLDLAGSDRYEGTRPARAGGNSYHGGTSLSLFLDLGRGRDELEGGLEPGRLLERGEHGLAADLPGPLRRWLTEERFARLLESESESEPD